MLPSRTKNAPAHLRSAEAALRKSGLGYPGAYEEFPWGHRAIKVKGKTFVFLVLDGDRLSLSLKLPFAGAAALTLPFASPTEYGLGKSGWVTARFGPGDDVPVDLLRSWLDESYRAIAPKRLAGPVTDERAKTSAPRRPPRARARRSKS